MPSAVGRFGDESLDQRAKDCSVNGRRKSGSRLAIGRVERFLGERCDMLKGGIATEDLEQEPVKGGIGTEDPGSPTVPNLPTDPLDGRAIQKVAEVLPNPPQCGINPSVHQSLLAEGLCDNAMVPGGRRSSQVLFPFELTARLVPF